MTRRIIVFLAVGFYYFKTPIFKRVFDDSKAGFCAITIALIFVIEHVRKCADVCFGFFNADRANHLVGLRQNDCKTVRILWFRFAFGEILFHLLTRHSADEFIHVLAWVFTKRKNQNHKEV